MNTDLPLLIKIFDGYITIEDDDGILERFDKLSDISDDLWDLMNDKQRAQVMDCFMDGMI